MLGKLHVVDGAKVFAIQLWWEIPPLMTLVVSKGWHRDSKVREEGDDCSRTIGRVGRDEGKSVVDVLEVLDFVPSHSMHTSTVKAPSRNSGSNLLLE